ncbi:MAG: hypothetical protein ABI559_11940 [Chloroflexota bacterium]
MIRTLVLGVCLMLAAVACGGGDDATSTPTRAPTSTGAAHSGSATAAAPNDVCSLVTRQEAAAAVGANVSDRAFTEPTPEPVAANLLAQVSTCAYSAETTGGYVKITLWEAPGGADKLSQAVHTSCSGKDEVSGVGDYACWFNDSHREMYVVKGSNYIDLSSSVAQDAALQQLVVVALSRLH